LGIVRHAGPTVIVVMASPPGENPRLGTCRGGLASHD
jgi:hypothetical protein